MWLSTGHVLIGFLLLMIRARGHRLRCWFFREREASIVTNEYYSKHDTHITTLRSIVPGRELHDAVCAYQANNKSLVLVEPIWTGGIGPCRLQTTAPPTVP